MFKRYLNYIEISTKITSVFAFLITISYLFSIGQKINTDKTLIFFAAMFIFDMTATAINNYEDTKKNDQSLQFNRNTALLIIIIQLLISTALGLYLAVITDIVVLLLGMLCFLFGILYSFGPISISKQPLGELFSGLFYGVLIPFILLYINMPKSTYLSFDISFQTLSFSLEIFPIITVLLLSIAPFCATANIMLANNICDLEKDITVKRFTLPYYMGLKALYLFAGLYYFIYLSIIIMVIIRILSPICLISLITIIPVQKNIKIFFKRQEKSVTFILSIKNHLYIMITNSFLIFISGLLK
ncbi:MAG: UbiA family prenyltransferase [Eubacteriales bacterium]